METVSKESYDLCDQENVNLRAVLAWALDRLPPAALDEMEKMLDKGIDDGGVVHGSYAAEERDEVVQLLAKIVAHTERVIEKPDLAKERMWSQRLDALLNQAREYEPKHPVKVRVGEAPNIFAPATGWRKP